MKKIMMILLGLALGSQALYAAEKADASKSFWDKLRSKVESMTPQKKVTVTTATGGVRGAATATEDLYWKDEATGQTIADEELEAFKNAMELIGLDDKTKAQAAFAEFVKKYPGSPLRKEADQALVQIGQIDAPAK